MKKIIFISVCIIILNVNCNQKGNKQEENQPKDSTEFVTSATIPAICQSCGMPLSDDMYGTNKDGSINEEYCKYCFENGHFTNPDITMEEMINICVEYMTEDGKMTEEEARKIIKNSLPTLKRWEVK
jgi:hypothetical protein